MATPAQDILTFWFEDIEPRLWFNPNDGFDALIRQKFETLAIGLSAQMPDISQKNPHIWESALDSHFALIIALDQFPRNMYRGTAASFAWDEKALMTAQRFVQKGWDLKLAQNRRAFAYMPYMHAEDLTMQDECVHLVDSRLDDESTLFHAKAHRKLIAEFGRFPYRNAILGRDSTPQEISYLKSQNYRP